MPILDFSDDDIQDFGNVASLKANMGLKISESFNIESAIFIGGKGDKGDKGAVGDTGPAGVDGTNGTNAPPFKTPTNAFLQAGDQSITGRLTFPGSKIEDFNDLPLYGNYVSRMVRVNETANAFEYSYPRSLELLKPPIFTTTPLGNAGSFTIPHPTVGEFEELVFQFVSHFGSPIGLYYEFSIDLFVWNELAAGDKYLFESTYFEVEIDKSDANNFTLVFNKEDAQETLNFARLVGIY